MACSRFAAAYECPFPRLSQGYEEVSIIQSGSVSIPHSLTNLLTFRVGIGRPSTQRLQPAEMLRTHKRS